MRGEWYLNPEKLQMAAWEKWKMRRVVEYDLLDIDPTMGVMTGRLIVGPSTLLNILGPDLFIVSLYQFWHIMSNCTIISFPEGERSPPIAMLCCLSVSFFCFGFSCLFGLFANISFSSWRQYWDIFSTEKASQAAFFLSFPRFSSIFYFFSQHFIQVHCWSHIECNALICLNRLSEEKEGAGRHSSENQPRRSMQVVWYAIQVW